MTEASVKDVLTSDHAELYDTLVARRYFAKFDGITGYLGRVASEVETEGKLTRTEARVLGRYLTSVAATFRALSHKYLMTGRGETAPRLTIDRHESGFPVAQELMTMAVDAQQAEKHLAGMPSEAELKDRMVRQIVGDQTIPTALQFALSQRYYYEALAAGDDMTIESSVRMGNMIRLERAMGEVTPPIWPEVWGKVDRTAADYKAGAALYDQHCAACHSRIDRAAPFAEIHDASDLPLNSDPLGGAPFVRVINAFDISGEAGPVVGTDPMMVCNSMTHASWSGKMTAFTNVFSALQSYALNGITGIKVKRFPVGTETLRLIEDLSIRILWDKQDEIIALQKSDLARQTEGFFAWFAGDDVAVEGGEWVIAQAEKVPTPTPVTHHLSDLEEVRKVCAQQLAVQRLTTPDAAAPGYKAGPLAGVFATAPFLHNGSVPTLNSLLMPPAERPTRFAVGDVMFDPVAVGLAAPIEGGFWSEFKVTDDTGTVIAGNSNAGHAYPAIALTADERAQLLAYLKGL